MNAEPRVGYSLEVAGSGLVSCYFYFPSSFFAIHVYFTTLSFIDIIMVHRQSPLAISVACKSHLEDVIFLFKH